MPLLDAVDALPVEAGAFRERLLREVRVESCGPDAVADGPPGGEDSGRGRSGRHPLNVYRIMIDSLYRGPYIFGSHVQTRYRECANRAHVRVNTLRAHCRGQVLPETCGTTRTGPLHTPPRHGGVVTAPPVPDWGRCYFHLISIDSASKYDPPTRRPRRAVCTVTSIR